MLRLYSRKHTAIEHIIQNNHLLLFFLTCVAGNNQYVLTAVV